MGLGRKYIRKYKEVYRCWLDLPPAKGAKSAIYDSLFVFDFVDLILFNKLSCLHVSFSLHSLPYCVICWLKLSWLRDKIKRLCGCICGCSKSKLVWVFKQVVTKFTDEISFGLNCVNDGFQRSVWCALFSATCMCWSRGFAFQTT